MKETGKKLIAPNKKAWHDYFIDTFVRFVLRINDATIHSISDFEGNKRIFMGVTIIYYGSGRSEF